MSGEKPHSIWTRTFALLCLAQFLGYGQHSILTPTFPLYITQLGGSPFVVGLVLGCFAVTSVIIRPLIGHWADRWSEAGVMVSGLAFLGASVLLCFLPFVETTMLANGLRGIGWAGLNAGGYSLLALTAPEARRGEASGYYSGVQGSATILFPAVALWLIYAPFGGFTVVFAVAVALALVGAAVGALMARHAPRPERPARADDSSAWWSEIFHFLERDIVLPSALLFCLNLSLPSVTSFIVLHAHEIGIENFGVYFVVSGATNLLARPLFGRASDKIGRGTSLAAGFALQVIALLLLVTASSLTGVIVSGVLYMTGNATASSATLALAVERANPQRRGKAMASFSVAYPLSYGVGSLLTGSAVDIVGYVWTYLFLAGLGASGVLLTLANWSRLKS
ncbi:MAG TPA: MFS transporter [Candidatus Binatia bacterium]|nr:MFS transporter [Candidatus Binatia bacterium]